MMTAHQREVNEIFNELSDLCMDWTQYSIVTSHDEEFDCLTITGPEWIKLMDDVVTARDFECDNIVSENGKVRLYYLRERDSELFVGESEGLTQ